MNKMWFWYLSLALLALGAGSSTFEGTIEGNKISGTRYRSKGTLTERTDSWMINVK